MTYFSSESKHLKGITLGTLEKESVFILFKWFSKDEVLTLLAKKEIRFEHRPLLSMLLEDWK